MYLPSFPVLGNVDADGAADSADADSPDADDAGADSPAAATAVAAGAGSPDAGEILLTNFVEFFPAKFRNNSDSDADANADADANGAGAGPAKIDVGDSSTNEDERSFCCNTVGS